MSRSKSSQRWLKEHFDDEYVKLAQREGYRSRAVYKLQEINDRDHVLQPGIVAVDLGAAPGGWSQLAAKIIGTRGRVIALDALAMTPLPGVEFLQGDFTDDAVLARLRATLGESRVHLVMSDMAPNMTGMTVVDQPRAMYLAELALDLACEVLTADGDFIVKVFQGSGFDEFYRAVNTCFKKVVVRKPKASRARAREVYFVARNYIAASVLT